RSHNLSLSPQSEKTEKFQLNYFLDAINTGRSAHLRFRARRGPSEPTAERVTSLGKDWHRPCLKCEKCNKTLSAGSHAEHDGKPYCNNPCYGAMFGPKGFGRGGTESHAYK
uniref:LIM zinc-binding domain-containing protein n=1 Tax=Anabas testudineus TaxID=64144 RepID=A0A3Q1HD91_ANATE